MIRYGILPTIALASLLALGAACGDGDEAQADGSGVESDEVALADSVPAAVPAPRMEDGVPIVEPEEIRSWHEEGRDFILVDARDEVQYGREHLPGAINVPYVDIRPGANLPPRDETIVVYCSDADCPISQYAYRSLRRLGYNDVLDMREGLQGWKAEGYPTVIADEE